ncbi:MAG: hypothetical protein QXW71_00875, partial [Thermoplasmata archaeon]
DVLKISMVYIDVAEGVFYINSGFDGERGFLEREMESILGKEERIIEKKAKAIQNSGRCQRK